MTIHPEPGETPLVKIDGLCELFGLPNLLVKDESKNPFGTFKDRRSNEIIKQAKEELIDKLCLITSGNAGYSLANFANSSGIKVVSIIDKDLKPTIVSKLKGVCTVIKADLSSKILTPEETISLARNNPTEVIWDVTNGYHKAYEQIAKELKGNEPDYLICPVGSGEAFVGLYGGIKKYRLKTKLVGAAAKQNPSFADKLHTPWTPYSAKIQLIKSKGHQIIHLTDDELEEAFNKVSGLLDCEPSSAAAFAVLSKLKLSKSDKVIVINSGKGLI
jgi:threonine synthase